MKKYEDYIIEIKDRQDLKLQPKPIEEAELLSEIIFVLLFTYDFLILAFIIVASYLGFVPTNKIKSDSSIPFIVELNK